MRILIADDDEGTRNLVTRALTSDGHDVVAVEDGAAAVEELAEGGFQLLIADIDMPGHTGVEVAQAGRAGDANLAVILITAHETQFSRAGEIPGGKVQTLGKPFSLEALRAAVSQV